MSKLFDNLFLSIGAMKAGTTWLYAMLERHPQLHFTAEKELHYFYHKYVDSGLLSEVRRLQNARDRYIFRFDPERSNIDRVRHNLRWVSNYLDRTVDDLWYRNLFTMTAKQVYACDFSNLHAHIPAHAWNHIHDNCGRLRILYTMRDPVKRLWSHTKFHLQVSGQIDNILTWKADDYRKFLRLPHIWENAEYGKVLRNLKSTLPDECWKVIFYEDVHKNQRGVLHEIEDFLQIDHHTYPEALLARRFTESSKHEMPDFFPGLIAKDVDRIRSEVEAAGFSIPNNWG
jgi:Sulfotransferase family